MPKRVDRVRNTPEGIAASLPADLRSLDGWHYPGGLTDYLAALTPLCGSADPYVVMSAAGVPVAGWFRHMLAEGRSLS